MPIQPQPRSSPTKQPRWRQPLVIPDREEDETRDDYAVRVMQAVSQHQINSFNQMIQSMRDISKEVKKKKKPEWEETDEDEDSDDSNYQDAPEKPKNP